MGRRWRRRLGPGWMVLVAMAVVAAHPGSSEAQRADAPRLGVDGLTLFREPGTMAVLAQATAGWNGVATPSEDLLGEFRYLPEYATTRTQGQIFRILASDAPEGLGTPGDRFVVVPWTFGLGCAEEGWGSPDWVSPGDTVAFLLEPTRTQRRNGATLPVFDVLGWHQPYPTGDLIPFWGRRGADETVWLSPEEFYRLLTLLPSEGAFRTAPEEALAPALRWIREAPGREAVFPVADVLVGWQEARRPGSP